MKQRIALGIIHNNEPERLSYINKTSKYFNNSRNVLFFEYSNQPITRVSYASIVSRNFNYLLVEIRWLFYRKQYNWDQILLILVTGLKRIISVYNKKHIVTIESIVTEKHIKLIRHILDTSDTEYIFILESDCIINNFKKFENALVKLIEIIAKENEYFINLGTGFTTSELKCLELVGESIIGTSFINQIRPFTNTAVAYGLNRNAANLFIEFCTMMNFVSTYLPIDWVLNKYFMSNKAKNLKGVTCTSNLVQHGSRIGVVKAWSR
jgi:hypothetical protein